MIYRAARPAAGADDEKLLEWLGISRTPKKVLSEVTYFTCLKMLSETLAKMPIKFYQQTDRGVEEAETNKAYELLKTRPNPQMTPSTFWATVENNRNHYGNAYVWIRREFNRMMYGGEIEIKDLWIMPSADTTIVIDDEEAIVMAEHTIKTTTDVQQTAAQSAAEETKTYTQAEIEKMSRENIIALGTKLGYTMTTTASDEKSAVVADFMAQQTAAQNK